MYQELDREQILDLLYNKPGLLRSVTVDGKNLSIEKLDYYEAATEIKFFNIKAQIVKNNLLRVKTSFGNHRRHTILITTYFDVNLNDFPDKEMRSFLIANLSKAN